MGSDLNIVLEADRLGSLNKNSPLYYRQIQIGRVTGARHEIKAADLIVQYGAKTGRNFRF
ncbi:MAG: hypothetical protein U9Q58_05800 [Pseudomonadota bacterium]|nr:hypothetical protein [Pseudomonadota bacterium]